MRSGGRAVAGKAGAGAPVVGLLPPRLRAQDEKEAREAVPRRSAQTARSRSCLEYAVRILSLRHWGGLNEVERKQLLAARRLAPSVRFRALAQVTLCSRWRARCRTTSCGRNHGRRQDALYGRRRGSRSSSSTGGLGQHAQAGAEAARPPRCRVYAPASPVSAARPTCPAVSSRCVGTRVGRRFLRASASRSRRSWWGTASAAASPSRRARLPERSASRLVNSSAVRRGRTGLGRPLMRPPLWDWGCTPRILHPPTPVLPSSLETPAEPVRNLRLW